MRLKSVSIRDFQRHKRLKIGFSPGITTITGETDTGKSAILRALRWVCLNAGGGAHYRRRGAAGVEIRLSGKDRGKPVLLIRKQGTRNVYILNGRSFHSFGAKVPEEIQDTLRLSTYNFQGQHDAPFWFGLPPGQVSKQLNALVNLSIMDAAMYSAGGQVRRAQERKAVAEERLAEIREQWLELKRQKVRIKDFKELEARNEEHEKAEESKRALAEIVSSGDQLYQDVRTNRSRFVELKVVGGLAKELLDAKLRQRSMEDLLSDLKEAQEHRAPPDFSTVQSAFAKWQQALSGLSALRQAMGSAIAAKSNMARSHDALIHATENHKRKTKGRNCPLCKQLIK